MSQKKWHIECKSLFSPHSVHITRVAKQEILNKNTDKLINDKIINEINLTAYQTLLYH